MGLSSAQKFALVRTELQKAIKEREELIEGMLVALIAKEPLFVLGPPGTAKSLACRALCQILGGNYFELLMTKFTTPEELFGPLSLKALEQDLYVRVTTGKLPEAHIVFLDEYFKSSSAIANSMLTAVNERIYHNNGVQKIPLQTLFAASNEIPASEELGALWDRMVLRYTVDGIKDDQNFLNLFQDGVDLSGMPNVSLKELEQAQKEAAALKVPEPTSKVVLALRNAIREKGIYVSDRKWRQAANVVRAAAYLNGHSEVEVEDLTILENVLWNEPSQISEVRTVVRKLCNPIKETLKRYTDSANEVMHQLQRGKIKPLEAFKKIKAAIVALKKEVPPNHKDVAASIQTLNQQMFQIAESWNMDGSLDENDSNPLKR